MVLSPVVEMFGISLALSFVLALVYRLAINPEKMKSLKAEVKSYQQKMKQVKQAGNKEEQAKFVSEMMKANQKMMKAQMKPMMASLVVWLLISQWLAVAYASVLATLPFPLPVVGSSLNWIGIYILVTAPFIYIFRKLLGAV